jgi:hypothetical protein
MDARINASAVRAGRHRSRARAATHRLTPAPPRDRCRILPQSSFHATGAAHGDCGHFSRRTWPVRFRPCFSTPENARELGRKPCPRVRKRQSRFLRPRSLHGHATIGSRDKRISQWILRRFFEAIVARWFCRHHRNPPAIPGKSDGQEKKSRVATPSRAKSPAKRRFPVHQTSPGCTERISKRWQMGGKIARPGAKR